MFVTKIIITQYIVFKTLGNNKIWLILLFSHFWFVSVDKTKYRIFRLEIAWTTGYWMRNRRIIGHLILITCACFRVVSNMIPTVYAVQAAAFDCIFLNHFFAINDTPSNVCEWQIVRFYSHHLPWKYLPCWCRVLTPNAKLFWCFFIMGLAKWDQNSIKFSVDR